MITLLRTDKMLQATPMKAGAPDATRPTLGLSWAYSYDWQVVDRSLSYIIDDMGMEAVVSLDAAPQILGGGVPPFSGTDLTTKYSAAAGFQPQVPNDMAAWAKVCCDLVSHVRVEKGWAVNYWSVWNEPDGTGFWSGTMAQYCQLYKAAHDALKPNFPTIKLGGPECGTYNPTWIKGLIDFCGQQTPKLALDFIPWHFYTGDLGDWQRAVADVQRWSLAAGIPTPALANGEWLPGNNANLFGGGQIPFRNFQWAVSDFGAAQAAAALIEMQRAGCSHAVFTNPLAKAGGTNYNSSGLISVDKPWATGNVFRMWQRLGSQVIGSGYSGTPGVWQIATKDPTTGKLSVLVAHLRFRRGRTVSLVLGGFPPGKSTTLWAVDRDHSNMLQAAAGHEALEVLPSAAIAADGTFTLDLPPCSVRLLEVGP